MPANETVKSMVCLEADILHRLDFEVYKPNCLVFYEMMCY